MTSPTEDKKEWEEERVISLIKAYKESPTLWNHHSLDYKNRKLKIRTLHKIAAQFGTTAEEVRRKIHNLRCQFNAELRKIKKKSAEHNIEENLVCSEWKYFEQLMFLADVYIERTSRRSNDTSPPNQIPVIPKIENSSESDDDDFEEPPTSKAPRMNQTERIFITNDHNVTKQTDDDYRIFGEYVASELKSLSDRNAKKLKLMIRKAILEVAEDEYGAETIVKSQLNY